jgi:hypothetical protein
MLAAFSTSSCGSDSSKAARGSHTDGTEPDLAAAKAALAKTPLGHVVSRDPRGVGRVVIATPKADAPRLNVGAETISRLHFERHAKALGLSEAAVHGATFKGFHPVKGGGGVGQFEQRVDGVEVFRARAAILVDASNQLVSIASNFPAPAKAWKKSTKFTLSAEDALAHAYTAHAGVPLGASSVRDLGEIDGTSSRNYAVEAPTGALQVLSATAKRVYFPAGDRLEPAFHVEILGRAAGSTTNEARGYVIAADDGRVLHDESLTMNEAFTYKVWADPAAKGIPADGPINDVTPHPTGMPDRAPQTFSTPVSIMTEGYNKNPNGGVDPWLPADATYTWGNNVRAYSDRNQGTTEAGLPTNDGFQDAGPDGGGGDLRAELTGPRAFEWGYDPTKGPNDTDAQVKAAITQIFYTTNWLHDYWYDSGFNELAGNAQLDNYGRGGVAGDPMRAEAQDSADNGQANNANMSPMSDGTQPRMQMYVWTGLPNRKLDVPGVTFSDPLGAAGFGPQTFTDVTGQAVLLDDGSAAVPPPPNGSGTVGTNSDGCQMPTNVAGKIAVVDRGACTFQFKIANVLAGNPVGIIIVNNAEGNVAVNPGGTFNTTVPLLSVSKEDGDKLKAVLGTMPTVKLTRGVEIMRDGTIDNTVVAHEWGHYWHHRLVQCSGASCDGMSEGWGDFQALMMVIRESDTFDGKTYALAQYASQGIAKDGSYFGIRRAPYSREMTKNAFTFQHIKQTSTLPTGAPLAPAGPEMNEAHNVGEIWAETLLEAYANLIDALKAKGVPFDEIKRRMADYLVTGMKATPNNPTFVEQRDAILAAVVQTGRMDDFIALAKGFAKRGLGVGAKAPPYTSTTLNEAVENFDFKGALTYVSATLDDSVTNCDKDGALDANETGKLTVTVKNGGWNKLTKTQITATSTDANLTFSADGAGGDGGGAVSMDPYTEAKFTLNVTAKQGVMKGVVPITINISDADAFAPMVTGTFQARVNCDEANGSSKTDDAESTLPTLWTRANTPMLMDEAWTIEGDAKNHVWHGDALPTAGETSLVSPSLTVSATEAFTIAFKHQFRFEAATVGTQRAYADGGVIEISEDNGTTWKDVSEYVDPMYPVTIYSAGAPDDTNPLAGKKAFGGDSAMYPSMQPVSLDLGNKLAGKMVKVRFRIGTDEGTGTAGWDIDDIAFGGITNAPFSKIVDNAGTCGDAGTKADAGTNPDGGGGAGGTGGAGGAGGTTTTESSCDCSVPGGRKANGFAAFGALSALAAMLVSRRRRNRS